jgi:hypothetical protein
MDPWQFFPANQSFLGGQDWGHDAVHGSFWSRAVRRIWEAAAVMIGEVLMRPLWQYL